MILRQLFDRVIVQYDNKIQIIAVFLIKLFDCICFLILTPKEAKPKITTRILKKSQKNM